MIGQTLGHYRIVEQIGAGGMGVVYRAHDERLERDVAVKVLPEGTLAEDTARKRFRKEALALSKINHPSIATVHDFDSQGGVDFLAMELVPGQTLSDKLASGALPDKDTVRLALQLVDGLAAAHAEGVVHRDLKPANIKITPDGRVKILDFGLAKAVGPAAGAATTQTASELNHVAGTLPYMAPEQLRGEAVDARSDVYAVGVVLFEMTTGRRPFEERASAALIGEILHTAPPSPGLLQSDVSLRLEEIILKCLEKKPDDRYQATREVLVDLRRVQRDLDVEPPRVVAAQPPAPTRVRPARLWGVVAVGLVLALLAVSAVFFYRSLQPSRPSELRLANIRRLTSLAGDETQPTQSPDGQFVAFVSEVSGNRDVWIKPVSGGDEIQVTHHPADDFDPDWSPDGSTIAFRSYRGAGGIYTIPAFGGTALRISDFGYRPRWSPDGTRILFQLRLYGLIPNEIYVMQYPPAGAPEAVLKSEGQDLYLLADWSHDGKALIVLKQSRVDPSGLAILPLDPPGSLSLLQLDGGNVNGRNHVWSSTQDALIFAAGGSLSYVTLDPSNPARAISGGQLTTARDDFPDVSRDGRQLAYNTSSTQSDIWKVRLDPATGLAIDDPIRVTMSAANEVAPVVLPDDRHLLFLSDRNNGRHLYVSDLDGQGVQLVDRTLNGIQSPSVSPDGRLISILKGNPFERFLIPFDPLTLEALGPPQSLGVDGSETWTADGKWISRRASGDGFETIEDPLGEATRSVDWPLSPEFLNDYPSLIFPAPSPDGRWLAFGAYERRDQPSIFVVGHGGGEPTLVWEGSGFPS